MSWAKYAIEALKNGKTATIKPRGNSMKPKVHDGDEVILEPAVELSVNNIVLVKVRGRHYLHLIKAIDGDRYLIGNNRGHINGWVGRSAIYGKVTQITRK